MRILIIEDDQHKLRQLADFVKKEFPGSELSEKRSYQSGLKEALRNSHDLLVIDMSLPTYEIGGDEFGGRTRAFAGREILSALKRAGVRTCAIVCTQFESFGEGRATMTLDELRKDIERNFSDSYIATVYYQPAETGWQEDLREALRVFLAEWNRRQHG